MAGCTTTNPIDNIRRTLTALDSNQWPPDLKTWLASAFRSVLSGKCAETALGLKTRQGKLSFFAQDELQQRDNQIRALFQRVADLELLQSEMQQRDMQVLSTRQLRRIIKNTR